jgi:hypothetical protein
MTSLGGFVQQNLRTVPKISFLLRICRWSCSALEYGPKNPKWKNCLMYLVAGFNHLETYESQLGRITPHIMEKKIMFQTTNQV